MTGKMILFIIVMVLFIIAIVGTIWLCFEVPGKLSPVGIVVAYAIMFIGFLLTPFVGLSFSEFGMPEWLGWLAWVGAWVLLFITGCLVGWTLSVLFRRISSFLRKD